METFGRVAAGEIVPIILSLLDYNQGYPARSLSGLFISFGTLKDSCASTLGLTPALFIYLSVYVCNCCCDWDSFRAGEEGNGRLLIVYFSCSLY